MLVCLLFVAGLLHAGGAGQHTHTATDNDAPLLGPFNPKAIKKAQQNLGAAAQFGQWSDVETWPVVAIHANLLPNGKVLAWDATPDDSDADPHTTSSFTTRVSLWDPRSNVHIPTNNDTNADLFCAGSSLLWDGRVLFAGGDSGTGGTYGPLENTNIYEYQTNTWRRVTNMATPRWYASVAALANGEMLTFAGGYEPAPVAEVFQFNETWRPLKIQATYEFDDVYQWLQATPEGNVISFGPQSTMATIDTDADGVWTTGRQRDEFEMRNYGSYAMFDVGKILVSGGGDKTQATDSAVLIDTATQQTTTTGRMHHKRTQHDLTILADGSVLAIGGNDDGTHLYSATGGVYAPEIWSPDTGQWQVMNNMQVDRQYHSTALLLPDGRVLSAGGGVCAACNRAGYREQNAEVFSPPYLFSSGDTLAKRPQIVSTAAEIDYARRFTLITGADTTIEKVHLIKLGAATHSQNQAQRLIPLEFSQSRDEILVRSPRERNLAPPGHYMLFIVDDQGVPSEASIVLVGQPLLRSGDVVKNKLLAAENDQFTIESSGTDQELIVTLEGVVVPTRLQVQSTDVSAAPVCTLTVSRGAQRSCRIPNREATRWLISVQSDASTDYILHAELRGTVQQDDFALRGEDFVMDRVASNSWNFYAVTLDADQDDLAILLTELSADVDLYVQRDRRPTGTADESGDFYCASYLADTKNESCNVPDAAGSTWLVGVYGHRDASYRLTTSANIVVDTAVGAKRTKSSGGLGPWFLLIVGLLFYARVRDARAGASRQRYKIAS